MPSSPARRALTALSLSLPLALTLAGPADAADVGSDYFPTVQGEVAVVALHSVSTGVQRTGAPPTTTESSGREVEMGYATTASSLWPPAPVPLPPPWDTCAAGCARATATATSTANASGVLRAAATTTTGASGPYETATRADATAYADDTITLSKAATVVLRGRFRARLESTPRDRGRASAHVETSVSAGWCQDIECLPVSFRRTLRNGGPAVDETFAVSIALPAGRSPVNARLRSAVSADVPAPAPSGSASSGHAEADVAGGGGSTQQLEYRIEVPSDVAATSGSGRLPIVGGLPPAPDADRTPPVITTPSAIAVESPRVVEFSATATDAASGPVEVRCNPYSGSYFLAGTRKVVCRAVDSAGNAALRNFDVTARGWEYLRGLLLEKVNALPASTRDQLIPYLAPEGFPICSRIIDFNQRVSQLLVGGRITLDQAKALIALTSRVREGKEDC